MAESFTILVVEDNETDFFLLQRAMRKNSIRNRVEWVRDGVEAIEYLSGQNKYEDRNAYPMPRVLIVDLKMPRVGGLELLEWIKSHPALALLPVLVMSSSDQPQDITGAYELGATSFFVKPANFNDLERLTRTIHDYWVQCVQPGGKSFTAPRRPPFPTSNEAAGTR